MILRAILSPCLATCLSLATFLAPTAALADEALRQAISRGDTPAALQRIRDGANLRQLDDSGSGALHWAVAAGNEEVVTALLGTGVRPNVTNHAHVTPLASAVQLNHLAIARRLLQAGADPDAPNEHGLTALMVVAQTNNAELAHLLLEHGADVNARELENGQTALMWASGYRQITMVNLLLQTGADPNVQSFSEDWERRVRPEQPRQYRNSGFTALLFAAREGCLPCAQMLLRAGAEINTRDPNGLSPLTLSLLRGHADIAQLLIEEDADVNRWDWWGRGPLYAAVELSALEDSEEARRLVRMLLSRGANPNLRLKFPVRVRLPGLDFPESPLLNTGATPLLRATLAGDLEVMELLLEHGADTELSTYEFWLDWAPGMRPLSAAAGLYYAFNGSPPQRLHRDTAVAAINLLLKHGASLEAEDGRGNTALDAARERGWAQVSAHLESLGAR